MSHKNRKFQVNILKTKRQKSHSELNILNNFKNTYIANV